MEHMCVFNNVTINQESISKGLVDYLTIEVVITFLLSVIFVDALIVLKASIPSVMAYFHEMYDMLLEDGQDVLNLDIYNSYRDMMEMVNNNRNFQNGQLPDEDQRQRILNMIRNTINELELD